MKANIRLKGILEAAKMAEGSYLTFPGAYDAVRSLDCHPGATGMTGHSTLRSVAPREGQIRRLRSPRNPAIFVDVDVS